MFFKSFQAILTGFSVLAFNYLAAADTVVLESTKTQTPTENFVQKRIPSEQPFLNSNTTNELPKKQIIDNQNNTTTAKAENQETSQIKDFIIYPFFHKFEDLALLKTEEALIILNDHSRWIVRNFSAEEQELYKQDPWQKKDDIRIISRTAFDRRGNFTLKNMRTGKTYPVYFDTTSLKNAKTHLIERIDSNGYFVTTENKIDWEIFWTNSWTSCLWRPFDRILINKGDCADKNTYLMINLNTQEAVNAEIIQWK